ncbi:Ribosomal lysine N-methyltransferase set10 [Sesbania bispinosa]|nr:Ribosomal lysine N-methyltransferase set10 [Sesbania bispinosa]
MCPVYVFALLASLLCNYGHVSLSSPFSSSRLILFFPPFLRALHPWLNVEVCGGAFLGKNRRWRQEGMQLDWKAEASGWCDQGWLIGGGGSAMMKLGKMETVHL